MDYITKKAIELINNENIYLKDIKNLSMVKGGDIENDRCNKFG